ncbi:hypothetical protein E2C01_017000 [Portunus trituberculatus]|uniref:Uncharacterized protein n=1 Tax=Portunus trituberculatus TaxID=210409 RepID=A0A5B7DQI2_PORTR|nr:hypothetical protein [Portunus trituberculatus]
METGQHKHSSSCKTQDSTSIALPVKHIQEHSRNTHHVGRWCGQVDIGQGRLLAILHQCHHLEGHEQTCLVQTHPAENIVIETRLLEESRGRTSLDGTRAAWIYLLVPRLKLSSLVSRHLQHTNQ